ncbi:MAG: hypothetical protein D6715_11460, partial [Calditrichaeota bacterium]
MQKSDATVRKPHLVIVTYYFPPMGGGGVQRVTKFLKYLDDRFWQVSVVTVKPSYFYSWDESLLQDLPSGIRVFRTGSLDPFRVGYVLQSALGRKPDSDRQAARESSGLLRRLANGCFLPDSRLLWLPFLYDRLRKLHRQEPIDLLLCTVPPFTAGLAGALAARKLGVKFVLDMRDAWTVNPYLPELTPFHRALQERLEGWCLSRATGVVFVNPGLANQYKSQRPWLCQKPTTVVRNGFDPDDFGQWPHPKPPPPLKIGIMGTIYSQGNRPLTLLQAVRCLKEEHPELARKLQLVFLGKWSPDFLRLLEGFQLQDV